MGGMEREVERPGGPAYSEGYVPEATGMGKPCARSRDGPGARPTAGGGYFRAPGNRTAGFAAPGRPLAALSSVASQPGWLPPPPCQGLPGSPLTDPASYCRALLLVVGAEVVVLQPDRLAAGRLAERVVGDFLVRGGRWVDR